MCFGKEAEVSPLVKDRYQRIVARVKCGGTNVNEEQVNRGIAWVYRRYAKDHDLYVLEHGAKAGKRGLWADSSPAPPLHGEKIAMCGRFEQSETPALLRRCAERPYSEHLKTLSSNTPSYNVAPGQHPWMIMLHHGELLFIGMNWGYFAPSYAAP
jgi:hypothetical protein